MAISLSKCVLRHATTIFVETYWIWSKINLEKKNSNISKGSQLKSLGEEKRRKMYERFLNSKLEYTSLTSYVTTQLEIGPLPKLVLSNSNVSVNTIV